MRPQAAAAFVVNIYRARPSLPADNINPLIVRGLMLVDSSVCQVLGADVCRTKCKLQQCSKYALLFRHSRWLVAVLF